MSDNIRTALYDADYTCVLANRASTAPPKLARVVGKHCESGDVVVRDTWLPADVAPGDLLAVAATGAYCRSMASNYNYVPRPPVVGVRSGASTVLLRRETEADLLGLDPGVERLREEEWSERASQARSAEERREQPMSARAKRK
jgi:diaminopimelate decarboxylase